VRKLSPEFNLPNSYFLYKKLVEIFSDSIDILNKNGLSELAKHLKYLNDQNTSRQKFSFDLDDLIHSKLNILFLAVVGDYPDFIRLCLEWFGYSHAYYHKNFDPLDHALTINSKSSLDVFADYFNQNLPEIESGALFVPFFGDSEELFFKALFSKAKRSRDSSSRIS